MGLVLRPWGWDLGLKAGIKDFKLELSPKVGIWASRLRFVLAAEIWASRLGFSASRPGFGPGWDLDGIWS